MWSTTDIVIGILGKILVRLTPRTWPKSTKRVEVLNIHISQHKIHFQSVTQIPILVPFIGHTTQNMSGSMSDFLTNRTKD